MMMDCKSVAKKRDILKGF